MLNGLRAFNSLVQRTNEVQADDLLRFYQEREWRIVGNLIKGGAALTSALTQDESATLLAISPGFFDKKMRFRSGDHRIVEQCQLYRRFDDRPVRETVNRFYVPRVRLVAARKIANEYALAERVIAAEDAADD